MGTGRKTDKIELPIPAEVNKLVQNLKEILSSDFTDTEIFAVLQECQMNPDEAVQRLLSQDKFHEVKSKRERRKEMKEAQELKVRGSNISDVIIGVESNIGFAPAHNSHNEVGKAANMRENPSEAPSIKSSSSLPNAMPTMTERPTCDRQIDGAGSMISSFEELSGRFQPAFIGGPHPSGYSSLADVVRLGRPRPTVSHTVDDISYTINDKDSVLLVGEFSQKSQTEEVQVSEHDATSKNHCLSFAESDCSFTGEERNDKVEGASHYGDGSMEDMAFHNSLRQPNEPHEVVSGSLNNDISATALNMGQLNLGKEEVSSLSKDTCRVVLPKFMEALDADCSHLSFGTFNSGVNTDIPQNLRFNPVESKVEKTSINMHGNSGRFADPLYGELSGSKSNAARLNTTDKNHELSVSSQLDLSKQNIHESRGYGCYDSKLAPDSMFKNAENYSSPWSSAISPHAREFHPSHRDLRTSVTQTPLAVDKSEFVAQSVKDPDSGYYLGRRQSNTKRCDDIVSCSGCSINPTEILDSGAFALPKAFSPTLPNTVNHINPQHLSAYPYYQASLDPEEQISYNADPQIYPHLQQSYQDSPYFHESLADVKPNLHNSRFNLPPYAKISAQAKFPNSMSTIPNRPAIGYESYDLLGARYNEANKLAMLQQNDNATSLEYGLGSRTMPTIPDNTYYDRLAQYPPSNRDNRYYNLNRQDEQLSPYRQGVPDNRYLDLQRQTELLSMYQQGIRGDRNNRQVLDRLLPLSQRGLPSSRYQNLPGQESQQLSQRHGAPHSPNVYAARQYPQGSPAMLPQSLEGVPPASPGGSSKQLQMNWRNFY